MHEPLLVVGTNRDSLEDVPCSVLDRITQAKLVCGGTRQISAYRRFMEHRGLPPAPTLPIEADMSMVIRELSNAPGPVCVLASGDPGFFGIGRNLARDLGAAELEIHPAPSAISLAFARLAIPWDDSVVVSVHGRPLDLAVSTILRSKKAAVLTSPQNPPEKIGVALLAAGALDQEYEAHVFSKLDTDQESCTLSLSLNELAKGEFDPLSVLVLLRRKNSPAAFMEETEIPSSSNDRALSWQSIPDDQLDHRQGMITKQEIRAVVLSKLSLPERGVLWDVGAGSGSIAVECALARPTLEVFAIERSSSEAERIANNASRHGVQISVVNSEAPAAFHDLPTPDRVFIGGGGIGVLDAVVELANKGARIVAAYAAVDRALAALERLGSLIQLSVSAAERLPDGGWRLKAANPVFLAFTP